MRIKRIMNKNGYIHISEPTDKSKQLTPILLFSLLLMSNPLKKFFNDVRVEGNRFSSVVTIQRDNPFCKIRTANCYYYYYYYNNIVIFVVGDIIVRIDRIRRILMLINNKKYLPEICLLFHPSSLVGLIVA